MSCSGKCTITESDPDNLVLVGFKRSPDSCPRLSDEEAVTAITTFLRPTLRDVVDGCPKAKDSGGKKLECTCERFPGQTPVPVTKMYRHSIPHQKKVGGTVCNYEIIFTVDIVRRVFDGICFPANLARIPVDRFDDVVTLVCDRTDFPDLTLADVDLFETGYAKKKKK